MYVCAHEIKDGGNFHGEQKEFHTDIILNSQTRVRYVGAFFSNAIRQSSCCQASGMTPVIVVFQASLSLFLSALGLYPSHSYTHSAPLIFHAATPIPAYQ